MVENLFNEPEPSKKEKRVNRLRFYVRVESVVALYTFATLLGVMAVSSIFSLVLTTLLGLVFITTLLGIAIITVTRLVYKNFRIWLTGSICFYIVFFCIGIFFIWSLYDVKDFVRVNFVGAMVWTTLLQVGSWIADMMRHPYSKFRDSEFEV